MKALRFVENELKLEEIAVPQNENEALVRVVKSGICNTDLEIVRGYAGFSGTIGHEFVGVVERSDDKNLIGKRVVGEINAGCGVCDWCKNTIRGIVRTAPFWEFTDATAHTRNFEFTEREFVGSSADVSDEQAIFTEPLAAAFGITEQVEIFPETRVAVIGDGKLGLLCAMCLGLKSKNTILVGKHREKLSLAELRNIEGVLLNDAVPKLNRQFDVVVEASGSESGFATALDLLKPRGKMVLKSTFQGKTNLEMWRVVVDEITIVGSRCGKFAPALELLKNREVEVENLISDEFSLSNGIKAMSKASEKGILKVVLTM